MKQMFQMQVFYFFYSPKGLSLGSSVVVFSIELLLRHHKKLDEVNESTDTAETGCKQVKNTETHFTKIELVCAEAAEEEAKKDCSSFRFHFVYEDGDLLVINLNSRNLLKRL